MEVNAPLGFVACSLSKQSLLPTTKKKKEKRLIGSVYQQHKSSVARKWFVSQKKDPPAGEISPNFTWLWCPDWILWSLSSRSLNWFSRSYLWATRIQVGERQVPLKWLAGDLWSWFTAALFYDLNLWLGSVLVDGTPLSCCVLCWSRGVHFASVLLASQHSFTRTSVRTPKQKSRICFE